MTCRVSVQWGKHRNVSSGVYKRGMKLEWSDLEAMSVLNVQTIYKTLSYCRALCLCTNWVINTLEKLSHAKSIHCTCHANDLKLSWCGVLQESIAPACHMGLSICYERNSRSSSVIEGFLLRPVLEFTSPLSLRILLVTACNGTVTSWLCPCTGISRSVSLVSAAIIVTGENRTRDTEE